MHLKPRKYILFDLLRLPILAAPGPAGLILANGLARGIVPSLQVVVTAGFIDAALTVVRTSQPIQIVYPWILAVIGLETFMRLSEQLTGLAGARLLLKLYAEFRGAIIEKRARLSYWHIEDHDTWDLVNRVADKPEEKVNESYTGIVSLAGRLIQVVGLLLILVAQVWWAALVIIGFSVPLFYLAVKAGRANYDAEKETARFKRKAEYLSSVLKDRENIEERSIFGYTSQMNDQWYAEFERARKIEFKVSMRWFVRMKAGGITTAIISLLIVAVLLVPAVDGQISLGLFIALANAVFGLVQVMSWELTQSMSQIAHNREYLKDLTAFTALSETAGATELPDVSGVMPFTSLVFRHVAFTYPKTDKQIFSDLTFDMQAGRHYAFVGVNGAGKTTIVKILTGLYPDYTGEILLNGQDIRDLPESRRKACFSLVFQDFAKYSVSLKDNIALGGVRRADDQTIRQAIDAVGLEETVGKLPEGWDTMLGKITADGQDLSGGEWQRVALARAIVNPAPFRILDEPTAALDPVSESRIYEEFESMSRGKTTLFISHRLGSTKLADEILVIDSGRVAEKGSHDLLMAQNGLYASMFETQRSWYQ